MPAYTDATESGDEMVGGPPPAGRESGEPREDTFFLPPDFPGASNLKAGDTVTFKVVGIDSNGDIEVSAEGGAGEEVSLADDLRATMSEPTGGEEEMED